MCFAVLHDALLFAKGNVVCDHRDKFRIRRLSLDAAHGVAEEPLGFAQRVHWVVRWVNVPLFIGYPKIHRH